MHSRTTIALAASLILAAVAGCVPAGGYHLAMPQPRAMMPGATQTVELTFHGSGQSTNRGNTNDDSPELTPGFEQPSDDTADEPEPPPLPTIVSARSASPDVVEVTEIREHSIQLEAKAPGRAKLEVEVDDGSDVETPTARVVEAPDRLELRASRRCVDGASVAVGTPFLTSIRAYHRDETFALQLADPRELVQSQPTDAVTPADIDDGRPWFVPTPDAPDQFSLTSKHGDASLDLEAVRRGAIDGVAVGTESSPGETVLRGNGDTAVDARGLEVGSTRSYPFIPADGDRLLCGAFRPTIQNATPEACTVDITPVSAAHRSTNRPIHVRKTTEADCEFSLTLEQANGGDGLTVTIRLPGSGEADGGATPQ